MSSDFESFQARMRAFNEEREWGAFHNPKDLAISISLEAAELLEVFQWSGTDLQVEAKRDHAEEELADVLIYCLQMADELGVDPVEAMNKKLEKNAERYPVEKCRGVARKHTEL